MARHLGTPASITAVTVLSLGTTLPELVVSAAAARAGKADVAVGNILGSCVFNALAVAGVASLVGRGGARGAAHAPPPGVRRRPLLFYLLTPDRQVSRWEGMLFVLAYGLFVMELVRLV
jgi:cation:H+ antiporter